MNRISSLLLVFVAASALLFSGCVSRAQVKPAEDATPVRIATATESDELPEIRSVGAVSPSTIIPLAFKVPGPVGAVLTDVGDRVTRGQLLASLATDEIDAALAQAQAALEKARRDAERMERLYADSVVALARFQDANTALSLAEAAAKSARFNRKYAEIRAPQNGRVLEKSLEPGQIVTPQATVFRLGIEAGWSVNATVPDVDVVELRLGDAAELEFDAFPGEAFSGRVIEIAETSDPRTGSYRVEIALDDTGKRLRSGFVARVKLFASSSERHTLLPAESLVRAEGRSGTVFVVDETGATARERTVTIAALARDRFAVSAGVAPGETVVTDGAGYLFDGAGVSVVN